MLSDNIKVGVTCFCSTESDHQQTENIGYFHIFGSAVSSFRDSQPVAISSQSVSLNSENMGFSEFNKILDYEFNKIWDSEFN